MRLARIGLILGAGGITGHGSHAGVLQALAAATGWDPREADVIAGTSAGAQVGAYLRAGIATDDLAAHAAGEPMSAEAGAIPGACRTDARTTANAATTAVAAAAGCSTAPRPWVGPPRLREPGGAHLRERARGSRPLDRFAARIAAFFPDRWPTRPLWLAAVRLDTGERVVFGRDETSGVGPAVAASCAIPAYFAPVTIAAARHVDGGVHSPTNLDLVAEADLDLVIVSAPMSLARRSLRTPALDLPARSFLRWRLAREARTVRGRTTRVVALQPTRTDPGTMGSNSMDPRARTPTVQRARRSNAVRLDADGLASELTAFLRWRRRSGAGPIGPAPPQSLAGWEPPPRPATPWRRPHACPRDRQHRLRRLAHGRRAACCRSPAARAGALRRTGRARPRAARTRPRRARGGRRRRHQQR